MKEAFEGQGGRKLPLINSLGENYPSSHVREKLRIYVKFPLPMEASKRRLS